MEKVVQVSSCEVLRSVAFRRQFRTWLQRQPESRRDVIDLGTDVLNGHLEWGGSVVSADGKPIELPPGVFDDIHSECSDGEWISEQRRNANPTRRYAERLLPRLQLYGAIGIIGGYAITDERRRADVAKMRLLLGRFNRVWRTRYVRQVQRIIDSYDGKSALLFGAAVRRLRLRFKAELDLWEAQQ